MHNWRRQDTAPGRQPGALNETPLPGVIDTIGFGYAALALRPQIVLPPILLDLYLWLGLRVTAKPLTARLADWLWQQGQFAASVGDQVVQWKRYNVFELLAMRLPTLRMPGLVPLLADGEPSFRGDWVVSDAAWWLVVVVALLALCGGFLLGATYLLIVASAAVGGDVARRAWEPRETARVAAVIALWLLAVAGSLALVSMPVLLLSAVGLWFGATGLSPLVALTIFPAAWGFMYFFFSVQALVVDRLGPFAAMRASYLVVRKYFWQSFGFIVISLTITTGIPYALRALTHQPAGLLLAIIVNAFVASGMLAAGMLFYRDRARRLGLPAHAAER